MERPLMRRDYYDVPFSERFFFYGRRLLLLPYLHLLHKLRKVVGSDMENRPDVFVKYFRDYELKRIIDKLGIGENDAIAAVKVLTYIHTLSGVRGEITEMTPRRSVRIEKHCPAAKYLTRKFCRDTLSFPTFCALSRAINPKLVHTHESFLSGGDDTCELVFELKE